MYTDVVVLNVIEAALMPQLQMKWKCNEKN